MLDDFALPDGLVAEAVDAAPGGRWRAARWSAPSLARVVARLEERGAPALASLPLARRLAAWDGAVGALLDPESDERRALLPALLETSRLSPEGLTEALEVVLSGWTGAAAEEMASRAGCSATDAAHGVGAVVLAGNVPGLAAQSLLPALVAGRPLLLKSARSEPLFAPALVAALARREPALGEAFAAVCFRGDDVALARAALSSARVVLAYGGEDAVAALAAVCGERLVAQGPKASVAFVGGEIDALGTGRALARDVALLDQRGCLSVHAVWVLGDAHELAEALAFGLAMEARRLPPGPAAPEALAAVQQLRGEAELRGALVGGLPPREGSVVLAADGAFHPSPGLRTVRVHAVDRIEDGIAALAPWRGRLQGAALAGEAAWAFSRELEALGISRVSEPGKLQAADAGWANGGIDPFTLFTCASGG